MQARFAWPVFDVTKKEPTRVSRPLDGHAAAVQRLTTVCLNQVPACWIRLCSAPALLVQHASTRVTGSKGRCAAGPADGGKGTGTVLELAHHGCWKLHGDGASDSLVGLVLLLQQRNALVIPHVCMASCMCASVNLINPSLSG